MRHLILLLPLMLACAKGETPQTESEAAPPAQMGLTDADVAGTWTGTSVSLASDTATVEFTQICGSGSCTGIIAGMTDTIMSTYTLSGDSAVGTSAPFMFPMVGANVTDSWTVHLQDGKAVGTGAMHLADNPDSVVFQYRFEASRQQ